MNENKPLQFSSLRRMEVAAVLYFLRKGVKLHFYSLGTILEENIWGVQRGEIPWLWVSNRGEKHPCWHTILLAKSSVLYLLRPLTLERGCPTPDRHFSVPTGEQEVYKTRRSDQLPYRIFACSNSKGIVNFFGSSLMESFRI